MCAFQLNAFELCEVTKSEAIFNKRLEEIKANIFEWHFVLSHNFEIYFRKVQRIMMKHKFSQLETGYDTYLKLVYIDFHVLYVHISHGTFHRMLSIEIL